MADSRERKKTFGFDACYDSMEDASGCQELVSTQFAFFMYTLTFIKEKTLIGHVEI